MRDLRIPGSTAAYTLAATIVVGLGLFATALSDYTTGNLSATESAEFIADNEVLMYIWNTITLVVFGVVFVVLALALHNRMKTQEPGLSSIAAAFGLIWSGLLIAGGMITNIGLGAVAELSTEGSADVGAVWHSLDAVQNGLTGGNEIVGGIWILLVSFAGLRSKLLPAGLTYLGFLLGATALVTIVPALESIGAVFGLGLIVWFVWLGVEMRKTLAPASPDRQLTQV